MTTDQAFHELITLVRQYPESVDIGSPATDELIEKAQDFLGISFPESYIKYLRSWGTFSVGPFEVYGITGAEFENSRIPNGIWFTYINRKLVDLPNNFVVLVDNNGDELFCVETPSGRVVVWDAIRKKYIGEKSKDIFNFILQESREWFSD